MIKSEHAVNMVCIPDEVLSDKMDGDDVSGQFDGKIVEHDGKRYISIHQIDGSDVEEMEKPGDSTNDSEDSSDQSSEDSNGYSNNSLDSALSKAFPRSE